MIVRFSQAGSGDPDQMGEREGKDGSGWMNTLEAPKGKKVHIRTFGCTFNHADSMRLQAALLRMGSTPVPQE